MSTRVQKVDSQVILTQISFGRFREKEFFNSHSQLHSFAVLCEIVLTPRTWVFYCSDGPEKLEAP